MINRTVLKTLIVIIVEVSIALAHAFRLGQFLSGQWYILYQSYFSDLVLPFGTYFLLLLNDNNIPLLRQWYAKAGIIFPLCATAEICQFFGYDVLGVTFDPLDILAYGIGTLTAAFTDVKILALIPGYDA